MFIRKKKNKSGSYSIQVLEKQGRKNRLVKTIGSSKDKLELSKLRSKARQYIAAQKGQLSLGLVEQEEWFNETMGRIDQIKLVGPELLLGKLFDEIGFDKIDSPLFRHLVISRLIYPSSKLKTIRYIQEYEGHSYNISQVYRYMDKLYKKDKQLVEQISYDHTLKILEGKISVVFYDVTTIYFEAEREDELRKRGFSKDGKHQAPQVLLGLLVSVEGYPLAYQIFEGNKYEGHTMLPVIDKFKERFELDQLVLVADAGLLNGKNISELIEKEYEFILGARIKTESNKLKKRILNLNLKNGQTKIIRKDDGLRLVVSYSAARAKKDAYNRNKGIEKLEKAAASGKLTKQQINNRGYNKYLKMEGKVKVSIDYSKLEEDTKWDGLKGYMTNTKMQAKQLIVTYNELWKIEKAFRISKTDLQIRPIYHHLRRRIEAHVCISFTAYKLYKELERQLKVKKVGLSAGRTIELLKTMYGVILTHPTSNETKMMLFAQQEQQQNLLKKFEISLG